MINFIMGLSETQIQITSILCMLLMFWCIYLFTRSLLLGLLAFESLNIWNITVSVTTWLDLGLKPFLPMWLSLVLLVLPLIIVTMHEMHYYE